jgi:acyl-CoA dehydrogenase
MTDDLFSQSLERFLRTACTPAKVRELEKGAPAAPLWNELEALGHGNAMLAEAAGGAALGFADLAPLVRIMGRHLLPVPLAETMLARALVARAAPDATVPAGPIVLACAARSDGSSGSDGLVAPAVPLAMTAELALVAIGDRAFLTPLSETEATPTGVNGSLAATLRWRGEPRALASFTLPENALREAAATLHAAVIASAMDHLLEMTTGYANTRQQFGKALAKFQAVQQQLAVMAEHVLGANMAVSLAFASSAHARAASPADPLLPSPLGAALAKQYTSAVAPPVTAIAHAVHGAIALSEEYDLQLYARRIYELRLAGGAESYWARRIGEARLAASGPSVDFVRAHLAP